ncbi:beta-1,3-galactosyl-O-glycosyl-glycoprotein beta-1,6-N-acetylglucosaminyltransferase 4-like [Gigantopelta aegis]|uniref:beta-1,3-galactosyl-O-glycosyl-glycoprotein beta-1,6-N-acetylglucosaminyltransferase 4-like n=1 Tax=Gigantopelta aegis TaxID=1735272 RepID=UPI001B88871A|nr:beta-1,3-galactosyl-O-glycosyl-glycoprotein beta-1,6-N-acetylglucosaminyltransferase 4-like [Gigantopelta aegis]XP_041363143.1 beta-1,3-galactosyl-O-glycosyl-glycoprotein beta-1,6-N-acetylglucosaminyltransferase 4-like [Gigantopelta aegis]XP_041363145.1 beta-1,3-galactosyl-O-glycosyl-glycoprotein beta-1,6-N-acetylglucosaminyltransferase 4-like [Gigantopelta aegis]XP_041363146.1 beta-1,3-galactosyl-O-glycosyl-glycoprotein beta-1,6-N-acetylglucosaminyltransferase 4-like [Gigantopelta aegis]
MKLRTLFKIPVLLCLASVFGILQLYVYLIRPEVTENPDNKLNEIAQHLNLFDSVCLLALANASSASYFVDKYRISQIRNKTNQKNDREVTENCTEFSRHLTSLAHVTDLERDFPIAFSVLVYRDPQQAMRLLRAIWRPQNVYCIHVDTGSQFDVLTYIMSRVRCLDNVFLAPRMIDVRWGTFSVLEADLICMEALYKHKTRWKYFINLTGQEFSLKTNYELVKILKLYAGGNDIFGQVNKVNPSRIRKLGPAPHGIKPAKGPIHMVASRGFVDYVLHNQTAKDFLEWVRPMRVPDETYFTSLNNNAHLRIPGSFTGRLDKSRHHNFYLDSRLRYKIFVYNKSYPKCHGKARHSVCLFGVGDLPSLVGAPHIFANKFLYGYQQFAYDCLERWIFKKMEAEKHGQLDFDVSPYSNIYFMNNCYCEQQHR